MVSTVSAFSTRLQLSLLAAVTLILAGAGPVSATSVTTPGLSVSSGGLIFNNFTCDFVGSGTMTGSCASINVTPLKPEPAGINLATDLSATGKGSADAIVTFDVAASKGVNTVGLSFDSTFLGLAVDSVTEIVYASLGGPVLGDASVVCNSTSGCKGTTNVNIYLYGTYTGLYITKDISVSSYVPSSSGSISNITQTFTDVPEPRSIALVGAVLVMAFLFRGAQRRLVS